MDALPVTYVHKVTYYVCVLSLLGSFIVERWRVGLNHGLSRKIDDKTNVLLERSLYVCNLCLGRH